jgi:hypothetical protein
MIEQASMNKFSKIKSIKTTRRTEKVNGF